VIGGVLRGVRVHYVLQARRMTLARNGASYVIASGYDLVDEVNNAELGKRDAPAKATLVRYHKNFSKTLKLGAPKGCVN
jgi:hypothetical protein